MRLTDCRSRRKASVARKESLRSRKVVAGEVGVSGTPGGHISNSEECGSCFRCEGKLEDRFAQGGEEI